MPIKHSKEGYLLTIPDLVVEIVSKNDTQTEIDDKVKDYLKAGVRFIWIADPAKQTISIHRKGRRTRVLGESDTLTIDEVIPGFQLHVKDAFAS